jgi:hypothetical protein
MERGARTPLPEGGWLWAPDHNAPALLELLPVSEQVAIGQQLGWKHSMRSVAPVAQHASNAHPGTRRAFIRV